MLQSLKTEVVDRLAADPYFAAAPGIPVIDERAQELDNVIDRAIADLGLCVFITIPVAQVTNGNVKGPYFDDAVLACRVYERPILNDQNNQDGTGKTGLETAQTVAALLHLFYPTGASEPLVCTRVALADDPDRVAYDVIFAHRGGIKYDVAKCDQPEITVDTDVTITCATAEAPIFYTITNLEPLSQYGILYTGAFAVPASGTKIRTRAWRPGYLGSKEASVTI